MKYWPLRSFAAFGLALGLCSPTFPQQKAFTEADLAALKTVLDVRIAPDASRVLYVLSEPDQNLNIYRSEIWIVDARGGEPRRLTDSQKGDEAPRWAPDGRHIAFISERSDSRQIWLLNLEGGDPQRLTDMKTGVSAFEWSTDGKKIAFLTVDPVSDEEAQRDRTTGGVQIVDAKFELSHLHVLDVATDTERQLTHGAFTVQDFSWSPDGTQIAFTWRPTSRDVDDDKSDVFVVSLDDGGVRSLYVHPGRDDNPHWSPDGKYVAFESAMSEVGEYASAHLLVVPAKGGQARDVTPRVGERIYAFYGWSPDNQTLYFQIRQGPTMQLMAAAVDNATVRAVSNGARIYDSFSFSASTAKMAFGVSEPNAPRDVYVSAVAAFRPARLVSSNPRLGEFRTGSTKLVHWKSRDGLEIEGIVSLPVGYVQGIRYPLITVLHGGPSAAFALGFAPQLSADPAPVQVEPYPPQLYAEHGFVLFMPNVRGSGGYGEQFRKADIKDWGGGDLEDVMSGIDMLIAQGIADEKHLGVMGWSYGGYLSAFAISQSSRFGAAQVGAGPSNMISMYGTSNQPNQIDAYFGGAPWQQEALYRSRSALTYATKIHTPTLIQHGENDPDVPLGQAQELYQALVANSVPVEFAKYPHSGHIPVEPKLNSDVRLRALGWFDRWLRPNQQKDMETRQ